MRIDLPAQARQAEGLTLETGHQDSDRDYQLQPINPLRFPQTTSGHLEDADFWSVSSC